MLNRAEGFFWQLVPGLQRRLVERELRANPVKLRQQRGKRGRLPWT